MKKLSNNLILLIVIVIIGSTFGLAGFMKAATAVSLGSADDFAILAGTGITIGGAVSTSTITGDIGSYATTTITGLGNAVLTGTNHAGDATTQSAKTALTTAYLNAEGQTPATTVTASSLDSFAATGYTLTPGIYKSASTMGITGALTLNGSATDVWIFQAGSSLTTAAASSIILTGGAQACNVFWQVGSDATLGAGSFLKGNILALTSIGLGTTANVEGRVLARNGAVTLDGSNIINKATCVPVPTPVPTPTPGASTGGDTGFRPAPSIDVIKIPTPLSLPLGPGSVTYDYIVSNVGIVPMSNVMVTDNKCAPVRFVSGNTNGNSTLDVNEVWKYRCTSTLSQTTTNTVSVRGEHDNLVAIDSTNATVVVGAPVLPPLIHVVKKPNVFVLPAGGGAVTYAYAVTNPGTVPLNNVSIIDDKCTGLPGRVLGHPGDLNKNNLLESNETWQFTCQSNLTQTTTNTAIAEGSANGLTAIDFSLATVVVAQAKSTNISAKLPSTGIPPDEKGISWNIAMLSSSFVAALIFYAIRKKQTV